jgi:uncharacterized membrane protein YcaP (DUF421 family)
MEKISQFLIHLLGLNLRPEQLTAGQVALRAIIIFIIALALMRLGHKRSLARKTAFDTALVVIVGAVLARAINGSGGFVPTIVAGVVLVMLHRLISFCAERSRTIEILIKGRPDVLLENGEPIPEKMRRHSISRQDIEEDLRLHGHRDLANVAIARLERSGDISCIEKKPVR